MIPPFPSDPIIRNHPNPITAIQPSKDFLFIGDADGCLTLFQLKKTAPVKQETSKEQSNQNNFIQLKATKINQMYEVGNTSNAVVKIQSIPLAKLAFVHFKDASCGLHLYRYDSKKGLYDIFKDCCCGQNYSVDAFALDQKFNNKRFAVIHNQSIDIFKFRPPPSKPSSESKEAEKKAQKFSIILNRSIHFPGVSTTLKADEFSTAYNIDFVDRSVVVSKPLVSDYYSLIRLKDVNAVKNEQDVKKAPTKKMNYNPVYDLKPTNFSKEQDKKLTSSKLMEKDQVEISTDQKKVRVKKLDDKSKDRIVPNTWDSFVDVLVQNRQHYKAHVISLSNEVLLVRSGLQTFKTVWANGLKYSSKLNADVPVESEPESEKSKYATTVWFSSVPQDVTYIRPYVIGILNEKKKIEIHRLELPTEEEKEEEKKLRDEKDIQNLSVLNNENSTYVCSIQRSTTMKFISSDKKAVFVVDEDDSVFAWSFVEEK